MKRKLFSAILCSMAFLLILPSCRKDEMSKKVDLIPVKLSKDGNWSMMDKEGKIVYEDEFKNTPSMAYNGLFSVKEGDGYTIYKIGSKKPEMMKGCENLKSVGYLEDGLIPVTFPNERISIIDEKGKKQFSLDPVKNQEIISCAPAYGDGLLFVTLEDGKSGYVDKKGKLVIPAKYKYGSKFIDGMAVVCESIDKDKDNDTFKKKYSVINKKGETVFNLAENYEPLTINFVNDRLLVSNDDSYYLFDKKGEKTKLPSKIEDITDMNEDYIIFKNSEGQTGVMDFSGEIIIRPKYKSLVFGEDDKFLGQREGEENEIVVVDKNGEVTKTLDYKDIMYVKGFGYLAKDGSTYSLLDEKFKTKCKEDIYDYNFTLTNTNVETDYFDSAAVAKSIVGMINSNGVGNYKFDSTPGTVVKDKEPREFTYKTTIDLEDLNKTGFRYYMTAQGMFTAPMADYNYDYYSYSTNYYWNSASRLAGVELNVYAESDWGEKGFNAMKTALQNDGYKMVKTGVVGDTRYGALYEKGDIIVYVTSLSKENSCSVLVASSKLTPNLATGIKELINSNGKIVESDSDFAAPADYDFSSTHKEEQVMVATPSSEYDIDEEPDYGYVEEAVAY